MKMLNLFRAKKVRVATARRHAGAAEIDYAEIPEPNMKLSRALLIVLLLHVVAVSGIIAFNVIKTRQSSFVPADSVNNAVSPTAATVQSTPDSAISGPRSAPPLKQSRPPDRAKPSDSPAKSAGADEHRSDHAKPVEHAKVPASSGKVYTVVKGDSPVKIAKKLKVAYEDLIALNHIEDPRRLKVGQKLLVPKKTANAKTTKRSE